MAWGAPVIPIRPEVLTSGERFCANIGRIGLQARFMPAGLLVSSNLAAGAATVTVNAGQQTIVTLINTATGGSLAIPLAPGSELAGLTSTSQAEGNRPYFAAVRGRGCGGGLQGRNARLSLSTKMVMARHQEQPGPEAPIMMRTPSVGGFARGKGLGGGPSFPW
jgi:hypothetical protein